MDTVHECDRQTDRQTDGRTDRHTDRITITNTVQRVASHGKNVKIRTGDYFLLHRDRAKVINCQIVFIYLEYDKVM